MARHYFTMKEARGKWEELLKLAEQGEEVIIIRGGSRRMVKVVYVGEATPADKYFSTVEK